MTGTVFEPLPIERIHLGAGTTAGLEAELARLGVERALLLSGRSLGAGSLLPKVRQAGAGRVAGVHAEVAAHNPSSGVAAAALAFSELDADAIVAFGGGSVIDCAKAVSAAHGGQVPLVDLPTTLSGAEWACSFGQTDDATRIKAGGRDRGLTARAVFLDPELCADTPGWLWGGSGMRAVDHAVETILAPNTIPYLDALAAAALRTIRAHLAASMGGDLDERMRCLEGSWMAHAGSFHIQWGLSHQMGRQLGPAFGVPHGHTSAVLLPAVVEIEGHQKPDAEARVALALGAHPGGAATALRALVSELGLPGTLREAGLTDRGAVAELFAGNDAAAAVVERAW